MEGAKDSFDHIRAASIGAAAAIWCRLELRCSRFPFALVFLMQVLPDPLDVYGLQEIRGGGWIGFSFDFM